MSRPAAVAEPSPDQSEPAEPAGGRVRHTLSGWKRLARIAYRDPEHADIYTYDPAITGLIQRTGLPLVATR
jgi:hypothetical protein